MWGVCAACVQKCKQWDNACFYSIAAIPFHIRSSKINRNNNFNFVLINVLLATCFSKLNLTAQSKKVILVMTAL